MYTARPHCLSENEGIYQRRKARGQDKRDPNGQSYGRFLTDSKGRYYFRTIKPPSYPGRTPHIHYAVSHKNKRVLTTQLYIEGEKQNSKDFLYKAIGKPKLQELCTVAFNPLQGSKTGELTATMDLIIGFTPEEIGRAHV